MSIERLNSHISLATSIKPELVNDCELDKPSCSMYLKQQISDMQNSSSSGSVRIGAFEFFQDLYDYPEDYEYEYDTVFDGMLDEYDPWEDEFGPDCYEGDLPDNGYDD